MSEDLRSRVAAEMRRDLQDEAVAGFPLLRRFPDTETAGVPGFFASLSAEEREGLLDLLAWQATHKWTYQQTEELKKKYPAFRRLKNLQPIYPEGDWFGARPKKAKLKKAVADRFAGAGFVRRKLEARGTSDWMEFAHPDSAFPGRLRVYFDPGLLRQLDYGCRDWARPNLRILLEPAGPVKFIHALDLDYHSLWRACPSSGGVCWDVITEANLEETADLLFETMTRLMALATRINALEAALEPM